MILPQGAHLQDGQVWVCGCYLLFLLGWLRAEVDICPVGVCGDVRCSEQTQKGGALEKLKDLITGSYS